MINASISGSDKVMKLAGPAFLLMRDVYTHNPNVFPDPQCRKSGVERFRGFPRRDVFIVFSWNLGGSNSESILPY